MLPLRVLGLLAALPLGAAAQQAPAAKPRAQPPAQAAALAPVLDSLGADIAALQASHGRLMQHLHSQGVIHRDLAARVAALPDPPAGTDPALARAVTALKRDAVQWDLRFQGLAQRVGQEEQRYQTVSNVLKVRHDTAKNSVQNVR